MQDNVVTEKQKKFVLVRLLQRLNVCLFLYLFVLAFVYILGNLQNFLDSSQILILQIISFTSILLILLSICAIVLSVGFAVYQKTSIYFGHFIFNLISCLIAAVFLILSASINFLASGTGA
ncbi:MAG: hypothetical protein IKZ86_11325 [Spirochaetaceae bacterium]|nr:hypothetical protein [Spirochaetaceae bacterium]